MNYIVREANSLRAFYHAAGRGIAGRVYENGGWGAEYTAVEGALENYTLTASGGKTAVYIVCQNERGDAILAAMSKDGAWERRSVLKNQADSAQPILLHPIITENGIVSLIYNTPAEDRGQYLVMQKLDERGQWAPAARIDRFYPMPGFLYEVQRVTDEHLIVFYQTRSEARPAENCVGYREVTPRETGAFRPVHSTAYSIADAAYLTTERGIHFLCAVKGMFSSQLIYRKKEDGFSAAVVLCEGQRIENCVLSVVNGTLRAAFMANGLPYECVSADMGEVFSRPARYQAKFCQNAQKAYYQSAEPQSEDGLFLRQAYVDALRPWDVQMIPELCEGFFPGFISEPASSITKPKPPEEPENPQNKPAPGAGFFPEAARSKSSPDAEKLKNELAFARIQLQEKEKNIERLEEIVRQMSAAAPEPVRRARKIPPEIQKPAQINEILYKTDGTREIAEDKEVSAADENPAAGAEPMRAKPIEDKKTDAENDLLVWNGRRADARVADNG
ncbi:MAG: hypothetical protein FWF44_04070 [Defluviitaleaceae bacterium]|nr:hypothetical protein [Defluviitaleaceae bacterium]